MIVLPMAGLSSRFFNAGYTLPKYQLPLGQSCVFDHVMHSFQAQFQSMPFLFIVRDVFNTAQFVKDRARALGISQFDICTLDGPTAGQADTVLQGLNRQDTSDNTPLFIFNIDTIRHQFAPPNWLSDCDGYLEVFEGEGEHWSFVAPGPAGTVLRTTEKQRISGLCSNGLYYFRQAGLFREACAAWQPDGHTEFYIAPLYNSLIARGQRIRYQQVEPDLMEFCGTPAEYEHLRQSSRVAQS